MNGINVIRTLSGGRSAFVTVRSRPAPKGRSGFSGPDRYVALVVVPPGVKWDQWTPLREDRAKKLGVRIEIYGYGYGAHTGPRSSLARAIGLATAALDELE